MLKEVSVGNLLDKAFAKFSDSQSVGDVGRYRVYSKTYQQFSDAVKRCRSLLQSLKLKEDDRILLLGVNSTNWLTVFFACIQEGIVVVPLDAQSRPEFVAAVQKQVAAKAFFNDRGMRMQGVQTVDVEALDETIKAHAPAQAPVAKRVPSDILEIVYTSGTTGSPKGVVLTNKNILYNVETLIEMVKLPAGLRVLSALPLSHLFQQVVGILYPFVLGEKIHLINNLKPSFVAETIKTRRIHALITVPGVIESLKNHCERAKLSPLKAFGWQFRLIGAGGAATPVELIQWWKRHGVKVIEGYGMTECGPLISLNTFKAYAIGSVGKPLPGIQVKLGANDEILVKGENVMLEYYKNPKATKEAIRDGWLRTGDQGEFIDGFLFIKGRISDIIKTSSGLKIHPSDIEAVLNRQNSVIESCVVQKSNKVHAVLLLEDAKKAKAVVESANKQLQGGQKIAAFTVWPYREFPKTPTGKIRKFNVLEQMGKKAPAIKKSADPVLDVAQRVLNAPLKPSDKLAQKGMDSLARVELVAALEQELGIEIEETQLDDSTSVAQLRTLARQAPVDEFPRWQLSWWAAVIRVPLRLLVRGIIRIFVKTACAQADRIRGVGPCIIVANHISAWDGPVIASCLNRNLAIPALPDYVFNIPPHKNPFVSAWRTFVGGFVALTYACYPFGKEMGVERSIRYTGELLDKGYSILIFPEGTRSKDGSVQEFREGIGILAHVMRVPVIPIRTEGLFHVLPAGRKWPKMGACAVNIGAPQKEFPRMSTLEIAKQLEEAVRKL